MLSALISSRSEAPEKIVHTMVEKGVISESDESAVIGLIPVMLELKPEVRKAVNERALANAVLPSFDGFESVLDIRIAHEERSGFALPVAIAFLDTDARDKSLWFQLAKGDVEELIGQLKLLLKQFEEAEGLIAKFSNGGK